MGTNLFSYVDGSPLVFLDDFGLARYSANEMRNMIRGNNFSGFSDALILCMAWEESNFDPFRSTRSGANGLMMVTALANREVNRVSGHSFDYDSVLLDPGQNIGAGSAYLGVMRRRFKGKAQAVFQYSTEKHYPVQKILDCERCVQKQLPCEDPQKCLSRIHK